MPPPPGFAIDATPFAVIVNQPAITSLNFGSPLTVAAGMHRDNVSVQTDTSAPAGGLTVTFTSSDTSLVKSPDPISIPSGQQGGNFTVTGLTTTPANEPVTITASATSGNVVWKSQTLQVTVVQPALILFSATTPRTVGQHRNRGGVLHHRIQLSRYAQHFPGDYLQHL